MTLAAAIYAHLAADAGVAALASTRIYPLGLPESELSTFADSITYLLLATDHLYSQSGTSLMRKQRWEISGASESYDGAHALKDAVIAALNMYRGVMGGVGGVSVRHCILIDERDSVLDDHLERGIYVASAEFEIAI
jgi:hypothetical protein